MNKAFCGIAIRGIEVAFGSFPELGAHPINVRCSLNTRHPTAMLHGPMTGTPAARASATMPAVPVPPANATTRSGPHSSMR
jgi:hypothetical protein